MLIEEIEYEELNGPNGVNGYLSSDDFKQKWESIIPKLDDNIQPIWYLRRHGTFFINKENQMIFILPYKQIPNNSSHNFVILVYDNDLVVLASETKSLTDREVSIKYFSEDLKKHIDVINRSIIDFFNWLEANGYFKYTLKNDQL